MAATTPTDSSLGWPELIKSNLRASDLLFRYEGDEFAALLPESDAGTAWVAAERIRSSVKKIESDDVLATVSVGIAEYSRTRSLSELMSKAQIALFKAKESGGDMSWRSDDPRKRSLNTVSLAEELTLREWDVLANLAQRRTEQEIAESLGISSGTVRSHKAAHPPQASCGSGREAGRLRAGELQRPRGARER